MLVNLVIPMVNPLMMQVLSHWMVLSRYLGMKVPDVVLDLVHW